MTIEIVDFSSYKMVDLSSSLHNKLPGRVTPRRFPQATAPGWIKVSTAIPVQETSANTSLRASAGAQIRGMLRETNRWFSMEKSWGNSVF